MSGSVNRVFLMGNLTRDVELKRAGDTPLAVFGIAVNRKYKTRDGAKKEDVTFVDCEAWGRTAEVMAEHLRKGSPVFVEGRLKLNTWEQDGRNRSKITVTVESFQFVGEKATT